MAQYNLGYAYQMMGNYQEAELRYQKTLESDANNLFAVRKLAELYVLRKEPEKAKPYYVKAVNHYEDSLKTAKDPKTRGELFSILAEIDFGAGNLISAEANLKNAIAVMPDKSTLHYNLAQVFEARGNFEEAAQEYRKEVEVDPSNHRAFQNLGILKLRSNQPEEAILCFQKVVQLDPRNTQGYVLLATAYQKLGKGEEAIRILQQVKMLKQEGNR
jgi:tetratricopeptide (TPR) repeat protein